ncbi:hypothetical protein D3C77_528030 [compost metagenome]
MNVGAFVQRDFLALELLDRLDCRALGHQDGFAVRRWRFVGDIQQVGASGLGEHRRRLAGHPEVDRADVQAFEQLRATGEFSPLHLHALSGKALLQRALGLEQHQGAVLLVTDTQAFGLGLSNGAEGHSRSKQSDQTTTQNDSAHSALLLLLGSGCTCLPVGGRVRWELQVAGDTPQMLQRALSRRSFNTPGATGLGRRARAL